MARFSRAVSSVSRLSNWGTTPICALACFDFCGMGSPSTWILPLVARACPVSIRIVVDLPAPFGPSSPSTIPEGTSRSSPFTAVMGPNCLTTPEREIAKIG